MYVNLKIDFGVRLEDQSSAAERVNFLLRSLLNDREFRQGYYESGYTLRKEWENGELYTVEITCTPYGKCMEEVSQVLAEHRKQQTSSPRPTGGLLDDLARRAKEL